MDDVAAPCPRAAKWPNFFGARQACRAVPARRAVPCPDMNVDDLAVSCPRAVLRPGGGRGGGRGGKCAVPCPRGTSRAVPGLPAAPGRPRGALALLESVGAPGVFSRGVAVWGLFASFPSHRRHVPPIHQPQNSQNYAMLRPYCLQ
ncbi:unnamed protein product [Prorocentrum cordatum]|uniref:Uncharacterized protein n=1 Tax=Prorocentrum cordatum TaxID=2364126 RepID=A0ABN9W3L4_9DINO|nr:unnamed protein product [Polarella glacialis]